MWLATTACPLATGTCWRMIWNGCAISASIMDLTAPAEIPAEISFMVRHSLADFCTCGVGHAHLRSPVPLSIAPLVDWWLCRRLLLGASVEIHSPFIYRVHRLHPPGVPEPLRDPER